MRDCHSIGKIKNHLSKPSSLAIPVMAESTVSSNRDGRIMVLPKQPLDLWGVNMASGLYSAELGAQERNSKRGNSS